jgi:class 3 adenylate cyclase
MRRVSPRAVTRAAHRRSSVAGGIAISRLTLGFSDPVLESRYQVEAGRESAAGYRSACLAGVVLWLAASMLVPAGSGADPVPVTTVGLSLAAMNLVGLLLAGWARTIDRQHALATPMAIANAVGALVLAVESDVAYAVSALLLIEVFWFVARTRFAFAVARTAAILAGFVVLALRLADPGEMLLDGFLLVAGSLAIVGGLYRAERGRRQLFLNDLVIAEQARRLEAEDLKSRRLLDNMLPRAVAQRLRDDPAAIADEVPDTSVLFGDLVGFTSLAARLTAADVVRHLDELFSRFDDLAAGRGVEKVKTIGDAYMAVGGLAEPLPDHASRVVDLGLAMIEATAAYGKETGLPLVLRVGCHTGPVVAGVIGKRKLSYDLWGDTVNVASRLESHGVAGYVQVSRETWERLGGAFGGRMRGRISLRGRGTMETWLLAPASSAAVATPAPVSGLAASPARAIVAAPHGDPAGRSLAGTGPEAIAA